MGYSNYRTLRQALKRLNIIEFDRKLFPEIVEVSASDWLLQTLAIAERLPLTNEKAKSERIIAPILSEVALQYENQVTLFSGEELLVDNEQDLSGACDFFIAKHPRKSVMEAPIITLAEAKDEDMDYGLGQCLAQMFAAQKFNEQNSHPQEYIYGCAVTGGDWKFLKLEGNEVVIDTKTYYLSELPKILGILHHIIQSFLV